ncbi:pantoate--beta-alanine ligase [Alkaliphilus crotonatoxidans]
MKVITGIEKMKKILREARKEDKAIGFVPTMGYLHRGHLSLIERASWENDVVVVSVFVNPTQFGVNEDFDVYPRDLDRDRQVAASGGAHYLFHPTIEEMYPEGYETYVEVLSLTGRLCGASRPGHFRGVTTVVAKLFNIIMPQRAYFGLKDAQQVAVITRMVKDLNMNVQIVPCPIVREEDGLAMSSRNVNLTAEQRRAALVLSQSLFQAKSMIEAGERDGKLIVSSIEQCIKREPAVTVDYIEAVDFETLNSVPYIQGKVLIALAARVGKVRLIDNIIVEVH